MPQPNPNRFVSAYVVRSVARAMLPFYRKIASNKTFASQWGRAVVDVNVTEMQRLFRLASPLAKNPLPGSFKSGYNVYFEFKGKIDIYGVDILLPPGTLKLISQEIRAHQKMAQAILPLYRALASDTPFAEVWARAIRAGNTAKIDALVRRRIPTPALRSISIGGSGVTLTFKFAFSPYTYEHLLYHPVFE
ncbi:hypothetical protein Q5741_02200 [Paenibacillus sp. JX-17]|uniref:Uncharacterized protein n=1 Tax=Paenibacillus lacisoli TaxID=3064525 RepID=A0ABT9C7I0_9BACL|nr:hypothetical protein [Paenibacillus sp. JX-17]MDO7905224.1 hypothetical protein [Paenibacillus sp. JX-17]